MFGWFKAGKEKNGVRVLSSSSFPPFLHLSRTEDASFPTISIGGNLENIINLLKIGAVFLAFFYCNKP